MVTGDNLLTAMSVARESGIIRPNKRAFLVEHCPGELDLRGRTKIIVKQVSFPLSFTRTVYRKSSYSFHYTG